MKKEMHLDTKVVHAGSYPDKETGAIMPPIYQTSTYVQKTPGKHQGYEYTRSHNPTRTRLEESLCALEDGKYAIATSSGMSAITLILHNLKKGSTIIASDDVYGGTYRLFANVFDGIHNFHFVNASDTKNFINKIKTLKPDMVWLESPTNPLLKIADIKKISEAAKSAKSVTVVDNTFASPIFQQPLKLGADIVLHSLTKYINGHSDVVGGAIILNNKKIYDGLWYLQNAIGPSQAPLDSWLVLRGIKTLAIRMKAHQENAMKVAKYLEKHPKVIQTLYPGLKSHPQHALAKKQMNGFSGMITFFIKGGLKESRRFLEKVKVFALAESLGGIESLVDHPAIMTHASIPKKTREELGISDNLIRLSVGIENIDDIIADLEQALK